MITTRESINYQFSLIFGYSSPNDLIAGDIIGPGKLTKERVKSLSIEVLKFFRMYNAMLRDYFIEQGNLQKYIQKKQI